MELGVAALGAIYLAYASAPQSRAIVNNQAPFQPHPIPGHTTHELRDTGRDQGSMPVNLPQIQARQAEPPSLPWDEVRGEQFMADGDRSVLLNRPHFYFPSVEVPGEPPRVQRDPLNPDDLRAYNQIRTRTQAILSQPGQRNHQIGRHHIPYDPRNATRQEVSQDPTLAGRMQSAYLSGSQDRNGPIYNMKDPSATVVRRNEFHWVDDRSQYQPDRHSKRQHAEYMADVIQDVVPRQTAIHQPTEHVYVTKTRSQPKYLNPVKHLHGYTRLSARDQRGEILDPNPMKKKRLLLVGDQGHVSSQVTHIGGHVVDGDALVYAPTPRRREILPEMHFPGLYAGGGLGYSFRHQNSGNNNTRLVGSIGEVQTREPIVSGLTPYTHTIGESRQDPQEHTYVAGVNDQTRDVRVDSINQYDETQAYHAPGEPFWQSDNVDVVVPLVR